MATMAVIILNMEVALPQTSTQIIEIPAQKKYSFFSTLLSMVIVILVPTALSFATGFLIGKYQSVNSEKPVLVKNQKAPSPAKGKSLYYDSAHSYKINYPSDWKATEKAIGIPGVLLETSDASVEIWLSVEQPVSLNNEQKAGLEKTSQVEILVNNQKLKMTQYLYKGGNYFSSLELTAKENNPAVSFWIKALDKGNYDQALDIVRSFSF